MSYLCPFVSEIIFYVRNRIYSLFIFYHTNKALSMFIFYKQYIFIKKRASKSVSRVLSWAIIYLRRTLLHAFSRQGGRASGRLNSPHYGVAPGGVYTAGTSPYRRWALTSPFHPYPCGRLFSVALSLESPPPDVIRHPCPMELGLSSSNFVRRDCPAYSPHIF